MHIIFSIVGAITAIFVVVMIHELGHFFVAKAVGIRVLRFSIGFGPALWSRKAASGTEFIVALLPLGGYVQMHGHTKEELKQGAEEGAYACKPLWARMLVVLAGPMANVLLAIVAFWLIFMIGIQGVKPVVGKVVPQSIAAVAGIEPGAAILKIDGKSVHSWQRVTMLVLSRVGDQGNMHWLLQGADASSPQSYQLNLARWAFDPMDSNVLQGLGVIPFYPTVLPIVDRVILKSPAAKLGLLPGDVIKSINQEPVTTWSAVVRRVEARPNGDVQLSIQRGSRTIIMRTKLAIHELNGKTIGFLGVLPKPPVWPKDQLVQLRYSWSTALGPAWEQVVLLTKFNVLMLFKLVTGKLSARSLGGPVSIFAAAGQAAVHGFVVYLSFIAFISVMLAFINVLPIPGLDGGHFMFQVIEFCKGSPVSMKMQQRCLYVGFGCLFLILLLATYNDFQRFF